MKYIVNADQYVLSQDNRYLVPFIVYEHNEIRYGFVDKENNIVISAKYDKLFEDFYRENDLIRVGERFTVDYGTEKKPRQYTYFKVGVINSKGEELIPCDKYEELYFTANKTLLIAYGCRLIENGCALIDLQGNVLIPFGKYRRIGCVAYGFARFQDDHGFGVCDIEGNTIIPSGEFEMIWQIDEQYPTIVVQSKGIRYTLPIEVLKKLQQELKTTGVITTPVERYLDYEQYLQQDFTCGTVITVQ